MVIGGRSNQHFPHIKTLTHTLNMIQSLVLSDYISKNVRVNDVLLECSLVSQNG